MLGRFSGFLDTWCFRIWILVVFRRSWIRFSQILEVFLDLDFVRRSFVC